MRMDADLGNFSTEDCKGHDVENLSLPILLHASSKKPRTQIGVYSHELLRFLEQGNLCISELPGLQHCKLSRLGYSFVIRRTNGDDDDGDKMYMDVPGHGRFPCGDCGFHLAFPRWE